MKVKSVKTKHLCLTNGMQFVFEVSGASIAEMDTLKSLRGDIIGSGSVAFLEPKTGEASLVINLHSKR